MLAAPPAAPSTSPSVRSNPKVLPAAAHRLAGSRNRLSAPTLLKARLSAPTLLKAGDETLLPLASSQKEPRWRSAAVLLLAITKWRSAAMLLLAITHSSGAPRRHWWSATQLLLFIHNNMFPQSRLGSRR